MTRQRGLLLAGYGVVLLGPLVLMTHVVKPGATGRVVVFADALGFAALSLLALQIAGSGRWARTTRTFGLRSVLTVHRQVGVIVLVLVVAHVVFLLADDPTRLHLLDPRTQPGRARAGTIALLGLVTIGWTSARRSKLTFPQWRALHLTATVVVLGAAFVHVAWVDSYTSAPAVRWTMLALVLAAAVALFWTRVAQPYATALRPYTVVGVRPERGDAVTVELAPDGHAGLRFAPGQFARMRPVELPYTIDDHPFSLSSSAARPDRPAFTIKALGDYTSTVAQLPIGAQILVDGPHGEAVHDTRDVRGRLLIAAGIGITPALSVLRTAAELGDRRPLTLIYGSRRWADVTFREELHDLSVRLPNLRVVHVLSRPEGAWGGERGRIDHELLRRYAPRDPAGWTALICGPPALVAQTAVGLQRLGLPRTAIQAEGF